MSGIISEILLLLLVDAAFAAVFILALLPLAAYRKAAFAILKRNFVGYFMNPTGYVFLIMFVGTTSAAAFWPHDFFTANLASLHQLNIYLPYILLIFIPAITMSIWSEERRQGTDELLLTLPADDFDVVFGKYLAAVAIYTCSLAFAQIVHYFVLVTLSLGELDTGLLCATYFGYWIAGCAMLSIGMVASFLTRNLTVGFILGVLFNFPLVFLEYFDVLGATNRIAHLVSQWSIGSKIDDFGRGVISLSSVTYFVMVTIVGLYLSMVLIGSRHWWGGRDGTSLIGHYFTRTASLALVALGATAFLTYHDVLRMDMTKGRVSSLSPDTLRLLENLDPERPVRIHAYIGATIPEQYIQTEYALKSLLKEFAARNPNIRVQLHDNVENFTDEAEIAEQRYGILPVRVQTISRGAIREEDVLLGAAFECGLEKVVVPFFDYGIPVEYELIRSIVTVSQGSKPKLGIVRTDAPLFATPTFAGGQLQTIPQAQIIDELEKTYDIEQIDPESPIAHENLEALLVVQPSSLSPEGLDNLIAAIKAGVPTAVFEDPLPAQINAPGTGDPRRGAGMMGMMQGPQPKGDINKLWNLLELDIPFDAGGFAGVQPKLAWQSYNPYPKLQLPIADAWVFASLDAPGGEDALNSKSPITSGLREVLFPFAGIVQQKPSSDLDFTPLVSTGQRAGRIAINTLRENGRNEAMLKIVQGEPLGPQVLAAHITGELSEANLLLDEEEPTEDENTAEEDSADGENGEEEREGINVVYVADIDLMFDAFVQIRARPAEDPEQIQWRFENVVFLLNIVDTLAGQTDFAAVRKHKPRYYTLQRIERRMEEALEAEQEQQKKFIDRYEEEEEKAESEMRKAVQVFQDRYDQLVKSQEAGENIDPNELKDAWDKLRVQEELANRRLEQRRKELQRERDREVQKIRRETEKVARQIQGYYKIWILPPPVVFLSLVGLAVFARRRLREREGISRDRLVT